ncbi:MAG TPA: helix-turn-helix domain-containing protein [Nannocystaceae bacterium]|nr:helix-turn-helix domain-containing protein [Nannocystaceae bacterium]
MHNQAALVSDSANGPSSTLFHAPNATPSSNDVVATRRALLELAERLGSVAQACRLMGFSRGTFYRMKERYAARGEAGLREIDRRGRVPKNRFDAKVEALVVELALLHPTWGRRRFVALLAERGVTISASGVRCIWKRHGLLKRPVAPTERSTDIAS